MFLHWKLALDKNENPDNDKWFRFFSIKYYIIVSQPIFTSSKNTLTKKQGRIHGRISRVRLGRSSDAKTARKRRKNKCVTDRPTDQRIDTVGYRVACTRLKRMEKLWFDPKYEPEIQNVPGEAERKTMGHHRGDGTLKLRKLRNQIVNEDQ